MFKRQAGLIKKRCREHVEFIFRGIGFGTDAPAALYSATVKDSHDGIGVADIDDK
jgi:hypothetical protein